VKPADQDALHVKFIADVRSLFSLVGDTSNLISIRTSTSYYLMDSVLLKLPAGPSSSRRRASSAARSSARGIRPEERTS
jgi:hypothetical protein